MKLPQHIKKVLPLLLGSYYSQAERSEREAKKPHELIEEMTTLARQQLGKKGIAQLVYGIADILTQEEIAEIIEILALRIQNPDTLNNLAERHMDRADDVAAPRTKKMN